MAVDSSETVIDIPPTTETELMELAKSPPNHNSQSNPKPRSPPPPAAPVIDRTLSAAANLTKLLPSGTVLAFQALSPSFTNKGACYSSNQYLTTTLIFLCALSCVFFSFTDSLTGRDGKLYCGVATSKGFYVFDFDGDEDERKAMFRDQLGKMKLQLRDYAHAVLAVIVFLAIAFSDSDIQSCLFPAIEKNAKESMVNLPLGAGFLASLIFLIFPSSRKGIGYSDPHQRQE